LFHSFDDGQDTRRETDILYYHFTGPDLDREPRNYLDFRSLQRRLRIEGDVRYLIGRLLLNARSIGRSVGKWPLFALQLSARASVVVFDLLEIVRSRSNALSIGAPSRDIIQSSGQLDQHPRFLGYWYDAKKHAAVAMHVGVDLIKHQGRFYINELNLDTAMRPERRRLYDAEIDPVLTGICHMARARRFRRVVLCAGQWSEPYREEAELCGRQHGLQVIMASTRPWQDFESLPMPGLPKPLEDNTLYVIFSMRHAPTDYLVHDKLGTATWLPLRSEKQIDDGQLVTGILTSEKPNVLLADVAGPWPNLVVKLAGWGRGLFMLFAKVRDENEARATLGLVRDGQIPKAMEMSSREKLTSYLQHKGPVLYQPYIRPDMTDDGNIQNYRLHMLISPLENRFLSVHGNISSISVPKRLPFGIVTDPGPYVTKFALGARFVTVDEQTVAQFKCIATQLGESLQQALTQKFRTEPPETGPSDGS